MYIFTITYNFDSDYVARKCETYEEALKMLKKYLKEEIRIIETESEYTPIYHIWNEDDVILIYSPTEYNLNDYINSEWIHEDCAYYRIFKVE